jgi:hypothetical protein
MILGFSAALSDALHTRLTKRMNRTEDGCM